MLELCYCRSRDAHEFSVSDLMLFIAFVFPLQIIIPSVCLCSCPLPWLQFPVIMVITGYCICDTRVFYWTALCLQTSESWCIFFCGLRMNGICGMLFKLCIWSLNLFYFASVLSLGKGNRLSC